MRSFLLGLLLLLGACGGKESNLEVVLNANYVSGAAPLEVIFTATVPGDSSGVSYSWDFGTGETAQGEPSHSYTFKQAGTFLVTVKVNKNAQTATGSIDVNVAEPQVSPKNEAPSVSLKASSSSGKAPLTVTFSAAATDPNGDALSYGWAFGDGETVTGSRARTHTFAKAGRYTTTVSVDDGRGGVAEAKAQITVSDSPKPPPVNQAPKVSLAANPTGGSAPLTVSFKADAKDPEGKPLSYAWDFGNGEKAEGNPSRTLIYTKPGTYTASVTVSDGLAETLATARVSVAEPPTTPPGNQPPEIVTATADPPSGTTPLQVEFSATAKDPNGDPLVYVWDFGDGVISGDNPARHTYQQAGSYAASVTVGDRKGGKARQELQVIVKGGSGAPDVPFYGKWAWAASAVASGKTFVGYLSISEPSSSADSSLGDFFVRGGKGAWTYCERGLGACGAATGTGRIDVLDFGDGETHDIVFTNESGDETLTAYDDDNRIANENGAPTFRGGGSWNYPDGNSDELNFTMVKVGDNPQAALAAALATLR